MNTITLLKQKELITQKILVKAILVGLFVVATTLGAYIRIPLPFTPVPITLQTFFVLLSGAILGRRLGMLSQASYLMMGIFGFPIFQGYGAGFAYLLGPTGGYLVGFIAAAFVTGFLMEKIASQDNTLGIAFSFLCGTFVIYAFGLGWLIMGYKYSFLQAFSLGFIPFIPGAAAKIAACVLIYSRIKSRTDSLAR